MRALIRNLVIVLVVLAACVWSIIPPDKKLRLGKDLRGGVSLIYSVQIMPSDPPDVIARVIDVLKQRVDPNGLSEISIAKEGRDRINITMPLPNKTVKALKQAYEAELEKLASSALDEPSFERLMRQPPATRDADIERVAAGNAKRLETLKAAAASNDAARAARAEFDQARADLKTATDTGADAARVAELTKRVDELASKTATAEIENDKRRSECLKAVIDPREVRAAFELSDVPRRLTDSKTGQIIARPSPRAMALERVRKAYPDFTSQLAGIEAAHGRYAAEHLPLDDAADLKRLLAGAGVLDFRITVEPGEHPQESRLRRELEERGPQNVQSTDAHWFKINKIDNWADSTQDVESLEAAPEAYFANRYRLTAGTYRGEPYVLCWDAAGSRLTKAEGDWKVASSYQSTDPQSGLPAISFEMNNRGAALLNELTGRNVGKHMAVLLDDEVYTAPSLRSRIGRSGQITGSFSDAELRYIIRVLAAGSLQAKLSPEPISQSTLGPEVGADNLQKGFKTGLIAFGVVTIFMIVYYFSCGAIAVFALAVNFLMVLAIMALNHAAFTLPGIAGIVLTFGQAIDSNVLIYERMREEFLRGADMRTAVRLGFSRAFSSIVDGNVANLIICAVLYYFGTPEIRGFAITLGIGVVTTLFTALFVSRLIFTVLVDYAGWSRSSQLPMAFPIVQRLLSPHVDWMRWRWVFLGALGVFLAASAVLWYQRGEKLLDTEFTGGTQVTIQFKNDPATNSAIKLDRQEVQDRVKSLASKAAQGDPVRVLSEAEVLPVNPEPGGVGPISSPSSSR